MDIGKPQRVIMVEPLEVELPVKVANETDPVVPEPVSATPAPQLRHHPARVTTPHAQPSRDI